MYQVSLEGWRMMDYYNRIESFINMDHLIQKILVEAVLDIHVRGVKIKSFSIQMLLRCIFYKKSFMEKYLCWFSYREPYAPYETMIEKMIGSPSNFSNVHEVVDDNNNCYRRMIIDAIIINQGDASECLIIDEEPNVDACRFFDILKYYEKLLWDKCTNNIILRQLRQILFETPYLFKFNVFARHST